MSTWRALATSFLVIALLGCDDAEVDLPEDTSSDEAGVQARDAGHKVVSAECDQAPDGTSCGDGGDVMHCLYNACVLNVCGDGIKAGDEVCDDGDQEDGDGCNSQCKEAACGNGLIDAREDCDDGNTADDDGCDSKCRATDAGRASSSSSDKDGGVDAGPSAGSVPEAGAAPVDAGSAGMDSSVADSGAVVDSAAIVMMDTGAGATDSGVVDATFYDAAGCMACVTSTAPMAPCRDYLGSGDFVAGCFNNADPAVVERCVALYRCGVSDPNGCLSDATRLVRCYCGTLNIDNNECFGPTAVPNGHCVQEAYAASGCTTPGCIQTNFVTPGLASYYAQYLALCTLDEFNGCAASCTVPLGPFSIDGGNP